MKLLIILFCALLSCSKVTVQGRLAKGNIKNTNDSILLTCLVFAVISVIFSTSLSGTIHTGILIYASGFGFLSAIFQIFYAMSLQSGPFSISCMMCNLSMVIPIVFSMLFFDETPTIIKFIGILLCFVSLFLNIGKDNRKISIKWLGYVFTVFISNGFLQIVQKAFAKSQWSADINQFLFWGYFFAFLITLVVFLIIRTKKEVNLELNLKNLLLISTVGIMLAIFQYTYTYANSIIEVYILSPSVAGLGTIMQMVSAKIIFCEKFSKKQIISICIGICSVLLMSL